MRTYIACVLNLVPGFVKFFLFTWKRAFRNGAGTERRQSKYGQVKILTVEISACSTKFQQVKLSTN